MAKMLADCRIRIEFPRLRRTYNMGLFYNTITRRIVMKSEGKEVEITPSELGQKLGRRIGKNIKG